jgi:uncharacterized protein (TIGR00304 family)
MMLSAFFLARLGLSLIFLGMWMLHLTAQGKTHAGAPDQKSADTEERMARAEVKGGAVVMIGPIPIVAGSDSGTALMLMLTAVGLMLFWFIMAISFWR